MRDVCEFVRQKLPPPPEVKALLMYDLLLMMNIPLVHIRVRNAMLYNTLSECQCKWKLSTTMYRLIILNNSLMVTRWFWSNVIDITVFPILKFIIFFRNTTPINKYNWGCMNSIAVHFILLCPWFLFFFSSNLCFSF